MRVTRTFTALAAVALVGVACGDDIITTPIPEGLEVFTATLNGANVVPALVSPTTATGEAIVTVMDNLVSWRVEVTGIENVSAGHIHLGAEGVPGGVIVPFSIAPGDYPTTTTIALGSMEVLDPVLTDMRAGNTYVNIHTSDGVNDPVGPAGDYPGGEIRGQLVKQ